MEKVPHTFAPILKQNLWVFGSVLKTQFLSTSDIDFLYEMDDANIQEEVDETKVLIYDKRREKAAV